MFRALYVIEQIQDHFLSCREGVVNGPFGSDLVTAELQTEGIPVIYVRDIKPGRYLRVSTVCVTPQKAKDLAFCDVRYGDILLAKVGEPPCDATPYLLDEQAIVTQDVIRIRPRDGIDCHFLAGLFNSAFGRNAVTRITIGGGRMRVSLTEFKSLVLPKPPIDEQRRIGYILAIGERFKSKAESEVIRLAELRSVLLENFMRGATNE